VSFEIVTKDILGRIGKLRTKRGVVETPVLLPVINPLLQPISPRDLKKDFGCKAIITNAYLLKKNFGEKVCTMGIHDFLGFDDSIMTDSGAYQILVYGNIEVTQEEIIAYQEAIDTDIGVMLDIPTGGKASRYLAEYSVNETLSRAQSALDTFSRKDILWVGPIQGGNHLDLVIKSAQEMGRLPFSFHALGSPTQIMEHYQFDYLVDMTMAAKKNIPADRPLHLFGAGHPFMFALAVSMGCDIFDSAAYALFAREGKYMMEHGTERLSDLRYLPCSCHICSSYTAKELLSLEYEERTKALARHNLAVCMTEIRRIKQAIREGRLWELVEYRCRGHPSLLGALKNLKKHEDYLERNSPVKHSRGVLYLDSTGLARPEIVRHRKKLVSWRFADDKIFVLLPEPGSKPFHRSREIKRFRSHLKKELGARLEDLELCVFSVPFGVTPLELDETFPLSQYETSSQPDMETRQYVVGEVINFLEEHRSKDQTAVIYAGGELGEQIAAEVEEKHSDDKLIIVRSKKEIWNRESLENLAKQIMKAF
jgi:7-cyano-7-deazaguanine tRNA-ribosyltransferase